MAETIVKYFLGVCNLTLILLVLLSFYGFLSFWKNKYYKEHKAKYVVTVILIALWYVCGYAFWYLSLFDYWERW